MPGFILLPWHLWATVLVRRLADAVAFSSLGKSNLLSSSPRPRVISIGYSSQWTQPNTASGTGRHESPCWKFRAEICAFWKTKENKVCICSSGVQTFEFRDHAFETDAEFRKLIWSMLHRVIGATVVWNPKYNCTKYSPCAPEFPQSWKTKENKVCICSSGVQTFEFRDAFESDAEFRELIWSMLHRVIGVWNPKYNCTKYSPCAP